MSVFYIAGYILITCLGFKTGNYFYFLPLLTIPLVFELFELLKLYNEDKNILPLAQPWHYPLENWEQVKQTPNASFFLRFMFARNITTWFMLLICFSLMISWFIKIYYNGFNAWSPLMSILLKFYIYFLYKF